MKASEEEELEQIILEYGKYNTLFSAIEDIDDAEDNGFRIIEEQSFPVLLESFLSVCAVGDENNIRQTVQVQILEGNRRNLPCIHRLHAGRAGGERFPDRAGAVLLQKL